MSGALDRKLIVWASGGLVSIGLLMVYSSSITPWPSFAAHNFLFRQTVFLVLGCCLAVPISRLSAETLQRIAPYLMLFSCTLLVAVLVPGVGTAVNGARRWFRLAGMSFQPSELAKVSLVLYLAWIVARKGDRIQEFRRGWAVPMLVGSAMAGLVMAQPDFGTAVFLVMICLMILFTSGIPYRHLLMIALLIAPLAALFVVSKPYRLERIRNFAESWNDPDAATYQVRQSLLAVGSGGLWGNGLGAGWQKLGFLPESNTDFVFAVLAEELGLAGTSLVLLLWGLFLLCGVRLAARVADDPFRYMASFGFTVMLFCQAMVNIAVVTASLPPKGIALPFISYGGSNLVMSLVSVALILATTQLQRKDGTGGKLSHTAQVTRFEQCRGG